MGMHHHPPGTGAQPQPDPESDPTFGGHGQLIVGTGPIYLSHLPMFMFNPQDHPHNFQVLLEVTFSATDDSDPEETYVRHRRHTLGKVYTLAPEDFVMLDLVSPDRRHPRRRSFKGRIFSQHFERPNPSRPDAPEHFQLGTATVNVEHVVYFQEFDPQAQPLPQLEYLLFGKGEQLYLAHRITRPPDFDHVLSVRVTGHRFTDDELRDTIRISFPGRRNDLAHRLQEGEQVTGQAQIQGADGTGVADLDIEVREEFYLEADELAMAM